MRDRDRTLARLRDLHSVAARAASAERVELSRWLHEGLAQELAAVGWGLDCLGDATLDPRADASKLRAIVTRELETVRGTASSLRDTEIETGASLASITERFVASFRSRTGLEIAVGGAQSLVLRRMPTRPCA